MGGGGGVEVHAEQPRAAGNWKPLIEMWRHPHGADGKSGGKLDANPLALAQCGGKLKHR